MINRDTRYVRDTLSLRNLGLKKLIENLICGELTVSPK
jgi:hypothetical protein